MSNNVIIGIDFGTTKSCVFMMIDDKVSKLSIDGYWTIPSVVGFKPNGEVLIGLKAVAGNIKENTTINSVKRLIGRNVEEKCIKDDINYLSYAIEAGENNCVVIPVTIKGETKLYKPEQISAKIFEYIRDYIEQKSGSIGIKCSAVITVPAYYNDRQRRATIEAGKLAGLNVLRVINEPTAAAIAYGDQYLQDESKKDRKRIILVYDFGGGTFDVSIIEVGNNEINVIATGGDDHLGGEDITNNLLKYYMNKLKEESGIDISNDNKKVMRLKKACEEAKKNLSEMNETVLMYDLLEDNDIDTNFTKSKLIEINRDIFDKTINIMKDTIKEGKLSKELINDIVLVGGSSRIPEVERLLHSEFPEVKINRDINPDEAVAMGASILAADICRGAVEKHFDNGSFALVDEDNNLISVINDIPPPPSALNTTHRSTMKRIVANDSKKESEELMSPEVSPTESPPQSPPAVLPPPPPPPPPPQLNDNLHLHLPIEIDERPEAPTSPEDTSEEYLPIATQLPIINNTIKETFPLELPKYINNAKPKRVISTIPSHTPPPTNHVKKIKSPFTTPSPQIKNKKNIIKPSNKYSSGNRKPKSTHNHIKINDVLSHGICKSTYREEKKVLETIVRKNTKLPCTRTSRAYHTTKDNQKFIKFGYYESDDCVLETANKIRQCRIDRIPPHRVGEVGFIHELSVDENQIINVRIYEESHKMPDITMTIVK